MSPPPLKERARIHFARARDQPAAIGASMLFALLLAASLARWGPDPSADVSRGGETAFAHGLERREIVPGRGPQRWTSPHVQLFFRDLPAGPGQIELRLRGQRTAVGIAVDGVTAGVLEVGQTSLIAPLPSGRGGNHVVELRTEGFAAGDGRRLGALLESATLHPASRGGPSPRLMLLFVVPAAIVAAAGLGAGLPAGAALAVAAEAS